jgi:hypothetical protein
MARTKIGTGRVVLDFALLKEANGSMVWATKGEITGSNGLNQTFAHEITERDEITIGPAGKKSTFRRVGADGIELAYVGKNGVIDHKKSGGVKPGKVDFSDPSPMWQRTVSGPDSILGDDGKSVTHGLLSVARSIGNRCWDMVYFNLAVDGVASDAASGPKIAVFNPEIKLGEFANGLAEAYRDIASDTMEGDVLEAAVTAYRGSEKFAAKIEARRLALKAEFDTAVAAKAAEDKIKSDLKAAKDAADAKAKADLEAAAAAHVAKVGQGTAKP